jgi:CRISPR-associated endonuclease Cas2
MGIPEIILEILTEYPRSYQRMRQEILGLPNFQKNHKQPSDETIRVTLSRLKKNGLLENSNGAWKITIKGLKKITRKKWGKSKNKSKTMIVAFDIPETLKNKRDWLRKELINLGFIKLQNSVWFGPAPLPKEFISFLQDSKLITYLKFFEAKKSNII